MFNVDHFPFHSIFLPVPYTVKRYIYGYVNDYGKENIERIWTLMVKCIFLLFVETPFFKCKRMDQQRDRNEINGRVKRTGI